MANGTGNHGQAHGSRLAGDLTFWCLFSFWRAVVLGENDLPGTKLNRQEFKNETLEPGCHGEFVKVQVTPQMSGRTVYSHM